MRSLKSFSAAVLIVCAGCSSAPVVCGVTGVVTVDGKPTDGVMVSYWPEDMSAENFNTRHAIAVSDAQGRYVLKCSGNAEGIEAGRYKVTLSRPLLRGKPLYVEGAKMTKDDGTIETLPKQFLDPNKTPILVTVPKGGAEIPLEVKTK